MKKQSRYIKSNRENSKAESYLKKYIEISLLRTSFQSSKQIIAHKILASRKKR